MGSDRGEAEAGETAPAAAGPRLPAILPLRGFSGALASRLVDPLITAIASDFATWVGVAAWRDLHRLLADLDQLDQAAAGSQGRAP